MDLGGNLPESLSQYLMLGHSIEQDNDHDVEEDSVTKEEKGDHDSNKEDDVEREVNKNNSKVES